MKIDFVGKTVLIEHLKEKILVIGDLHLGFSQSMRESGVFVPPQLFEGILEELEMVFNTGGYVDKIILLGDLKHEFGVILGDEWSEIEKLIDYLNGKLRNKGKIVIVKGNHDIMTNFVTRKKNIEIVDYFIYNECAFLHGDRDFKEIYDVKIKKWFLGHGHPAIVLQEKGSLGRKGIKKEKYKCFLAGKHGGKEVIILPSFFSVNEGTDARDLNGEDLGFVWDFNLGNFEAYIVEGEGSLNVLKFGKVKNI